MEKKLIDCTNDELRYNNKKREKSQYLAKKVDKYRQKSYNINVKEV